MDGLSSYQTAKQYLAILLQGLALSITIWQDVISKEGLVANSPFSTDWVFYVVFDALLPGLVFLGLFFFFSNDVYRLIMANSIIQIFVVVLFAAGADVTSASFCIIASLIRMVVQFKILMGVGNSTVIDKPATHFFMFVFEGFLVWSVFVVLVASGRVVTDTSASGEARLVYNIVASMVYSFVPVVVWLFNPSGLYYPFHAAIIIDCWTYGLWPPNLVIILWVMVSFDFLLFMFNCVLYFKARIVYTLSAVDWREHFVTNTFRLHHFQPEFITHHRTNENAPQPPSKRATMFHSLFASEKQAMA
jgi:hypothetical protein